MYILELLKVIQQRCCGERSIVHHGGKGGSGAMPRTAGIYGQTSVNRARPTTFKTGSRSLSDTPIPGCSSYVYEIRVLFMPCSLFSTCG